MPVREPDGSRTDRGEARAWGSSPRATRTDAGRVSGLLGTSGSTPELGHPLWLRVLGAVLCDPTSSLNCLTPAATQHPPYRRWSFCASRPLIGVPHRAHCTPPPGAGLSLPGTWRPPTSPKGSKPEPQAPETPSVAGRQRPRSSGWPAACHLHTRLLPPVAAREVLWDAPSPRTRPGCRRQPPACTGTP